MSNSKSSIQVYLFFNGACEEALKFYQGAVGAQVEMMMRYKESPQPPPPGAVPPGFENKIMHATFRVGQTTLMASDGCEANSSFKGFSLSFNAENETEARRVFAAFSEGGKVEMPLSSTFWSPLFGMVTDRFGVGWMVGIAHK